MPNSTQKLGVGHDSSFRKGEPLARREENYSRQGLGGAGAWRPISQPPPPCPPCREGGFGAGGALPTVLGGGGGSASTYMAQMISTSC